MEHTWHALLLWLSYFKRQARKSVRDKMVGDHKEPVSPGQRRTAAQKNSGWV